MVELVYGDACISSDYVYGTKNNRCVSKDNGKIIKHQGSEEKMADENVGGATIANQQLDSYLNEVLPESDYVGERYKFQGDILIVKSLAQLYDDIRYKAFTIEGQKLLRGLIKDISDSIYALTKLDHNDVERMMNFLTIQEKTLILSLNWIDVTSDLNIIFAELEKVFFASLKRAERGFEREMAATGIVKQRTEVSQQQQQPQMIEEQRERRHFWER